MIKKAQNLFNHKVARNSLSIFLIQFLSMLAPLLVLPYLSRTTSVDSFGLIMLVFSISAMSQIITDFGFNLSATYQIVKNKNDTIEINKIIGGVCSIKTILLIPVVILVFLYNEHYKVFPSSAWVLFTLLNVCFQSFIPIWFFQGIEKINALLIATLFSKLLYVALVFIFIRGDESSYLVILLYAISNLLNVCLAYLSIYKMGYKIVIPSVQEIVKLFKHSSQFFLSRAAVSIYSSISTFFVGTYGGMHQVALYGSSEKLFHAAQSVTSSVTQALFPYLTVNKNSKVLFISILAIGFPLFLFLIPIYYFSSDILSIFFGNDYYLGGSVFKVFIITVGVTFISSMFGYPAFTLLDKVKYANYTIIVASVFQVVFLLTLWFFDQVDGFNVALSVLTTQSIILISRVILFIILKRKIVIEECQ
ncbi:hypothetical protein C9I86_16675 [Photobacterium sp. NCIMB 13483]|uniref:oligosaccharide flippase family protein n=1 Tax=Photobacterium sp. NCIMB 13483 TaxID=2022103 RepID=UPI000D159DAE|nr:oligosaccharide flippase family protein [Photobacterium sp. NCIMB 13483]PST85869.1 hypothetical protein C9I86_16675 [Photobacterium sp. NCIMB 13483]